MENLQNNIVIKYLTEDRYRVLRHVIFLLGLLLFYSSAKFMQEFTGVYRYYVLFLIWFTFIGMFYINMYILVPVFFFRARYLSYIVALFSLAAISISFMAFIISDFFLAYRINNSRIRTEQIRDLYQGIFISVPIILTTTTLKLFQRWIKDTERISELQNLTLTMELNELKNQINPHFLFNMLNNIKVLIKKDPEKASEVLMKLSKFLRYQLYENNEKTTPLALEVNSISNFLNFEEIRRDHFSVSINCNPDLQSFNKIFIPPNLFTTFVENAVKHSYDITDNKTFIEIYFVVKNEQLNFICRNSKSLDPVSDDSRYSGLGLKNITRRLELLYPDTHILNITSLETEYIVNLSIPL
ncbi:sensor histidine kinase [Elizabethkingia meningoseptica]|uniref:sensor histidine kinase n=1 Tax=Elizabethkingia meningoseptica TaxID=238 RepID=UPI0023B109F1|nr:histidine kinase [Elizabethkingia meningoseptica]MDE5491098.1 histidine kinase [Elizabethkingia meningoseptica]